MRELFRRLHYLLNRRRFDRELESDMQAHRQLAANGQLSALKDYHENPETYNCLSLEEIVLSVTRLLG